MAKPQEWIISGALKNDRKRAAILSTLKEEVGNLKEENGFIQTMDLLNRFHELRILTELLPAITFFTEHWDLLSAETQQAFELNS